MAVRCKRPGCGGLMVERIELGEEGYFHQLVCSACSRGVTTPINRVYGDRQLTLTPEEQVWAARRQRTFMGKVPRAQRIAQGLCDRCGEEPAVLGRIFGPVCLAAANVYAKAYYRRKKKERERCR